MNNTRAFRPGVGGRPNYGHPYARGLVWLTATPPTGAGLVASVCYNACAPSRGPYALNAGAASVTAMSTEGPYTYFNTTSTVNVTSHIIIPVTQARSWAAIVACRIPRTLNNAFCGWCGTNTAEVALGETATSTLRASHYDGTTTQVVDSGVVVTAGSVYAMAATWRPGVGLYLAVNGVIYSTLYTARAGFPVNAIFHQAGYDIGPVMTAGWNEALSDDALVALTETPRAMWKLFWQPRQGIVVPNVAATPTFLPAWARPLSGMIGAGVH